MKKDIEAYVVSCSVYASMKCLPGRTSGLLQLAANPTMPWEEIAMDFIVELPESGRKTVI